MERGVADIKQQALSTGWLTRQLATAKPGALLPGIGTSDSLPASLLGSTQAAAIPNPAAFSFYGDEKHLEILRKLHKGDSPIHRAGARTLEAIKIVNDHLPRDEKGELRPYAPDNDAQYPGGELSDALTTVARLIKMDVGLQVAAVDYGGWDTHQNQADHFPGLVEQLAKSLAGFYNDLGKYHVRLSVVVMSEFGRRVKSNESSGTDHGHGNVMLALGGNVNGGKIFGPWPGLATEQLDDRADLAVTTDYRTVLAELLVRRTGNTKLAAAFPGLKSYQPLGIFRGEDKKTDLSS